MGPLEALFGCQTWWLLAPNQAHQARTLCPPTQIGRKLKVARMQRDMDSKARRRRVANIARRRRQHLHRVILLNSPLFPCDTIDPTITEHTRGLKIANISHLYASVYGKAVSVAVLVGPPTHRRPHGQLSPRLSRRTHVSYGEVPGS